MDRSENMRRVRHKDTGPELAVRSALHKAGYRYRLHERSLPGHPDLVFRGRKAVVFIHGCFWHQHEGCRRAIRPSTNTEFWNQKLASNAMRDREAHLKLQELGWSVHVVWECEVRAKTYLLPLTDFLDRKR